MQGSILSNTCDCQISALITSDSKPTLRISSKHLMNTCKMQQKLQRLVRSFFTGHAWLQIQAQEFMKIIMVKRQETSVCGLHAKAQTCGLHIYVLTMHCPASTNVDLVHSLQCAHINDGLQHPYMRVLCLDQFPNAPLLPCCLLRQRLPQLGIDGQHLPDLCDGVNRGHPRKVVRVFFTVAGKWKLSQSMSIEIGQTVFNCEFLDQPKWQYRMRARFPLYEINPQP